jgi:hypothetical protein
MVASVTDGRAGAGSGTGGHRRASRCQIVRWLPMAGRLPGAEQAGTGIQVSRLALADRAWLPMAGRVPGAEQAGTGVQVSRLALADRAWLPMAGRVPGAEQAGRGAHCAGGSCVVTDGRAGTRGGTGGPPVPTFDELAF